MNIKQIFILSFTAFCILPFVVSPVQGSTTNCPSCEDIQNATSLAAIEKLILAINDEPLLILDEKALRWYAKFQKGGFFYSGWQQISADVVTKVEDNEKLKAKIIMLALGVKIGCEWSKENDVRKITTQMLRGWGRQLRSSMTGTPEETLVVINSIEAEVHKLLR